MHWDWTLHLSDILMAGITIAVVPLVRFLTREVVTMRQTLGVLVSAVGKKDPPEGLLGDMEGVKHETRRHRDRLIRLEVEGGLKIEDRS